MPNLAHIFGRILTGLRLLAQRTGAPVGVPVETVFLAVSYLIRAAHRLERLHALWLADRLPAPRGRPAPTHAARPNPGQAAPTARPRLPRRKAWLRRALGHDAGNFGTQLVHLLLRPDAPAFLAAAPQAARILRPILHALGTPIPAELALPPRPPRQRPARPARPPQPEPKCGKYDLRAIRRYSPGRIPEPGPGSFRKTA